MNLFFGDSFGSSERCKTPGTVPRFAGFHFLNLCRSHLYSQRRVPFALFPLPDDASQKPFSWFSDRIQKVQKIMNLADLVKSFQTSIYCLLAKFGFDTADNGPLKVCQN